MQRNYAQTVSYIRGGLNVTLHLIRANGINAPTYNKKKISHFTEFILSLNYYLVFTKSSYVTTYLNTLQLS